MKYLAFPALAACAALGLSACATVTDGDSQYITLTSNAPNAACSIMQNGNVVIPASPVPASHLVPKRAGNLTVDCAAEGYEPGQVVLMNGKHPGAVTGVALTGALINVGADAISHSWHEYQDRAYVHLIKKSVL